MEKIIDPVLHEKLLELVESLLEQNLEDPDIEKLARQVLEKLKENGHEFSDPDVDHECSACLHLSLMGALGMCETVNWDFNPDSDEEYGDLG